MRDTAPIAARPRALRVALLALAAGAVVGVAAPSANASCSLGLTVLQGAGTSADPYLVTSGDDLYAMGRGSCSLGAHYRLAGDVVLPPPFTAGGTNHTPNGTEASPFTGTFDGDGHSISGLDMTTGAGNVGLFGVIAGTATVRDLTLVSSVIRGLDLGAGSVGALVGTVEGGTIENVTVTGAAISGAVDIGGLVGKVDARSDVAIRDVAITGQVIGSYDRVGGLVGSIGGTADKRVVVQRATVAVGVTGPSIGTAQFEGYGGAIGRINATATSSVAVREVVARGSVDAAMVQRTGGLVGDIETSSTFSGGPSVTIEDSGAAGSVTSVSTNGSGNSGVGGLVGTVRIAAANGVVRLGGVWAKGPVRGDAEVGGLLGRANLSSAPGATGTRLQIVDAFASGAVAVELVSSVAGGLIGYVERQEGSTAETLALDRVYASGAVLGGSARGGLIGQTVYLNSYDLGLGTIVWDEEGTGQRDAVGSVILGTDPFPAHAIARTTAQMKSLASFPTWLMVSPWQAPAADRTWGLCASVNAGYPFLLVEYDAMPCAAASAPTGLAATAGDGSASVEFTAPASPGDAPITGYEVSLDDGASWSARASGTTETPVALAGLANGTSYRVRLRAVTAVGLGAASDPVTVTPKATPADPLAVTAPKVLSGGRVQVRMTVTGPGSLSVSGSIVAGRAAKPVCSTSRKVRKAGTYALTCRLDAKTRARLSKRSLRLRVTTTFKPTSGAAVRETSTVTLPRRR